MSDLATVTHVQQVHDSVKRVREELSAHVQKDDVRMESIDVKLDALRGDKLRIIGATWACAAIIGFLGVATFAGGARWVFAHAIRDAVREMVKDGTLK